MTDQQPQFQAPTEPAPQQVPQQAPQQPPYQAPQQPQAYTPQPAAPAPAPQGQIPQGLQGGAPDVVFDFTGTMDDGEPLVGWHRLQLEDITTKPSKSGEPQTQWIFRVVDGPRAGLKRTAYVNVAGPGSFRGRTFLKAFGIDAPKGPFPVNFAALRGRMLYALFAVQRDNPQFDEIKQCRSIDDPPKEFLGQSPIGAPPAGMPQPAPNLGQRV